MFKIKFTNIRKKTPLLVALLHRQMAILSIIFMMVVTLSSCDTNTILNQNVDIPNSGWFKNNAVAFNVDITDTLINYDFGLNIINTVNYRYNNLYIFLTTEFPNGNVSRDTIECILADNTGKWIGKGWGDTKENYIDLKSNLRFPLSGKYKFLIQQAMRVDTLKGITKVGLSIKKSD